MTGQFRYSIDNLLLEIKDLLDLGINSIILLEFQTLKILMESQVTMKTELFKRR